MTILKRVLTSVIVGVLVMAMAGGLFAPSPVAAADTGESGRFVWHDLLTKNVSAARRFYGDLFGWQFEDVKRGGRPYVLARLGMEPVAGFVDVNSYANAGPQWLSYMAVADLGQSLDVVRSERGSVLVEPRDLPAGRVSVVADPEGAPLGLVQLHRTVPDPTQPVAGHFFWQEYLARDATQGLAFYKRLGGFESAITDTSLGLEYHVLRKTRPRAGLFQLPANVDGVLPNWLPYVLVNDPATLAMRVTGLGGRILVAAAPERRNGSLVVIADSEGAPLALQKYPFK